MVEQDRIDWNLMAFEPLALRVSIEYSSVRCRCDTLAREAESVELSAALRATCDALISHYR